MTQKRAQVVREKQPLREPLMVKRNGPPDTSTK
ncbi:unnamed protein product [Wuchereria bancrofti]|nr:unnamed protein product [Wuchereria bancrofti]